MNKFKWIKKNNKIIKKLRNICILSRMNYKNNLMIFILKTKKLKLE